MYMHVVHLQKYLTDGVLCVGQLVLQALTSLSLQRHLAAQIGYKTSTHHTDVTEEDIHVRPVDVVCTT